MQIDINTKMITLIGTPLGQSFAARMQNKGYEAAGLNLCYFYCEADDSHLAEIINGVRYMPPFAGCAVTKPSKVKVLPYLDELDPLCQKMGACNTVVKTPEGKLRGYNTDGSGFYMALTQEMGYDITGKTFFCFGAGGAGRAICSVLAYYGAGKLYITDIFPASSQALVDDINRNFAPIAEAVPSGEFGPVREADMVINASGVGFGATIGQSPLPEEHILPHQFYFDAAYNPDKTQFLRNAEKKGCRISNGLDMSLYQGVAQIELWTGAPAPVEAMRQELKDILSQNG